MDDALFEVIDEDGDRATFLATGSTRGPWSAEAQHGGPIAALIARQLTRCEGSAAFHPARLTLNLLGPAPVGRVQVTTSTLRGGKRVRLLGAELAAVDDDRVLVRAELQQIRLAEIALPEGTDQRIGPVDPPEGPEGSRSESPQWDNSHTAFHSHGTEHRLVAGAWGETGPSIDWIRLAVPVVSGEEPHPLARVAGAADFGNGVSSPLPYGEFLFINPDLTIHLHRLPVGEWIGLDASSWVSEAGIGQAQSALHDVKGRIGSSMQSLLIDRL